MINFQEQDFSQEFKQKSEYEFSRPFQRSPITKQLDQCQQEKSEIIDMSVSIRNDFSNLQIEKKKTNSKTSFKILGLVKVDKVLQNFKSNLTKRAYVFNKQSKAVISKLMLEKYLNKETQKSNKFRNQSSNKFPIFEQSSLFISFWEFIRTLSLMSILWVNPFIWSFQNSAENYTISFLQYILTYLSIDILVRLNTSLVIKGNIIRERRQIFSFYIQDELIQDFLLIFSIIMISTTFTDSKDDEDQIISTGSLFICCFVSYSKLNDQINKLLLLTNISQIYREYLNLISLLFSISSFAHVLACVWHYVGQMSGNQMSSSWLIAKELQNETVQIRYCYSYYWATVTMITVGYGDISPQNYIEVVACIILMFMACGVFAFSINKIGSILQNINDQKAQFTLNIRIITNYMRQHNIPLHLQDRIRSYLQYLQNLSVNQNYQKLTEVKDSLSIKLKSELMYYVFKFIIQKSELLISHFSDKSLQVLSGKIKPFQYCPDEIIYLQGSNEDSSIYFIDYGEIKLIENQSQTELCTLKSGQQFGEWEFFTQQSRQCTAVSVGFSKVYKIQREDFMNSLDFDDTEQFHFIKDKMLQNLPIPGIYCQACDSKNHTILKCNYLFYKPDLERIILVSNTQDHQNRNHFKRKYIRLETLKKNKLIQSQQRIFLQNYSQEEKAGTYQSQEFEGTQRLSATQDLIPSQDSPSQEISINQMCQDQLIIHPQSSKMVNYRSSDIKAAQVSVLIQQQNQHQTSVKDIAARSNKYLRDKTVKTQTVVQNGTICANTLKMVQSDKAYEFLHYFTHQNCSKIIAKYNQLLKSQKRQSKKSRCCNSKYSLLKQTKPQLNQI